MSTTAHVNSLRVRESRPDDLTAIRAIYNEGIVDRIATLDDEPQTDEAIREWYLDEHGDRYGVLVAERDRVVVGWASLNRYSHRCAYAGVADLSVYVERAARGNGVGTALLRAIEGHARHHKFHKIVLFALANNQAGQGLYRKMNYRDVGVFREQGRLDGRFVDVIAMEHILKPLVLFVCKHNAGRSSSQRTARRRSVVTAAARFAMIPQRRPSTAWKSRPENRVDSSPSPDTTRVHKP